MPTQIDMENKEVAEIAKKIKANFGNRLHTLITEKEITHEDFATEIGVSENTITNYCKGKTFPHIVYAVLIADALDVNLKYLLGLSNSKNGTQVKKMTFADIDKFIKFLVEADKQGALNIQLALQQKDTKLGDTMHKVTTLTCTYFDPFVKSELYPRNDEAADAVLTLIADILPKRVQDKYFVVKGNIYRAYGSEMADNPVYTYSGVDTSVYDYINQGNSLKKLKRAYNKEKHTLGLISGLSADTFLWISYMLGYYEVTSEETE